MIKITISRRIALMSLLFLALTVAATALAHTIGASSGADAGRQIRNQSFHPQTLREMVQAHQLASTVQVLSSQPPSVIIQFPLFPSGVKQAFPQATGVVTIIQGNPAVSLFDPLTVDFSHSPPVPILTTFFMKLPNNPFEHFEKLANLITPENGSVEQSSQLI